MTACNRTLEQARRDFAAGLLKKAAIVRVPMSARAWTVHLSGRRGDAGALLDVATLAPQVFARLDDAARALEQIGFTCDQLTLE